MALLDRVLVLASVVEVGARIFDAREQRKRARENDEKDRRIRDLEERLAKLEGRCLPVHAVTLLRFIARWLGATPRAVRVWWTINVE